MNLKRFIYANKWVNKLGKSDNLKTDERTREERRTTRFQMNEGKKNTERGTRSTVGDGE